MTAESGKLAGKVALITGGNTGIGRAIALAYAKQGAHIAIAWFDREPETESLGKAVKALNVEYASFRCDVTDETQVQLMVEQVVGRFGRLDILVNNAGIQKSQPIIQTSVADFDRMLAVHLRGAFLCSREFVKYNNQQPNTVRNNVSGHIINLCSQLGYIGRADYTAYSTAKGGMIAFTRALARELAPQGILVNGVAPGLVDTGFDPLSDEAKHDHAASLPLGRLGTPDDMTSAFVFLASDDARYYCGQLLHPNGGEIMP